MLERTTWLVGGRLASDAMALVFYIALARVFGQGGIGDYSFAFAIAAFFGLGVQLGLPALLTREVARHPQRVHDYFGTVVALQAGLSLCLGGAALWLCMVFGYARPLTALVLLAFVDTALRGIGRSFAAYLEGVEAMDRSALLEVFSRLVVVGVGIALLLGGASLQVIMTAHVLGGGLYLGLSYYWVAERFGRPRPTFDARLLGRTVLAALPFVATVALYELYAKIDIVMLHRWVDSSEAGIYAVAVRLVTAPIALSFLAGAAMYPALSRDTSSKGEDRRALFLGTLRWLGLLGVVGGVVLATIGDRLVVLLFEDAFRRSGDIARWMSIVFMVQFVGMPYWRLLYASDREGLVLRLQAVSLMLNIGLNVLLIPLWGAYGALWASVASETFIVGAFHRKATDVVSAPYRPKALRLGVAGMTGLVVGLWTRGVVVWPIAGAFAVISFAGLAAALGLVRLRDLKAIGGGRPRRRQRCSR